MGLSRLLSVFIFLNLICSGIHAQENNPIHVVSHNKTLMVTDPSRGINEVTRWAVFPSDKISYRKIIAHLTMQCPDGMKCGAWDYLDYIIIKKQGGINSPQKEIEIIRNLTPYGSWFGSEWKFTWTQDVTDWGYLLRDSVEIEYRHTGYEDNRKMGWLVTVDFEIITGKPVMEALGCDSLWNGSFAYGDTLRPFETQVKPRILAIPPDAKMVNLRIIQTGHGMDRPDNCSEFCPKWREVFMDNRLLNHREMTIVCGTNPLYPQSGTWIYNRSHWCPGSLAVPDIYTLPVNSGQHTFDLKMEPYVSFKPSGGWSISAYAFYYKAPSSQNDATLEAIIAPSIEDAYNRLNPIGFSPRILVKNSGSNPLRSLQVEYGLKGCKKQRFQWMGNIPFLATEEIELPGIIDADKDSLVFEVQLLNPNKKKDEYLYDNANHSLVRTVPVYKDSLIVSFHTNQNTEETFWQIRDSRGDILYQRNLADSLRPETLYNDTILLPEGYYEFSVNDSGNDGLYFWANAKAGYGYIRLLNTDGTIVRDFNSDFGTFIRHAFKVDKKVGSGSEIWNSFALTSYVTRDILGLDIVLNEVQDVILAISDMENDKQVFLEQKIYRLIPQIIQLDVSFLRPGFYTISMQTADEKIFKRTMKKN